MVNKLLMETSEEKGERLGSWTKNVKDCYKHLETHEIKEDLAKRSHPFSVMYENVLQDFNLGTGVRNANAFNARSVYYFGRKRFDRRGLQGTQHYLTFSHIATRNQLVNMKDKYYFVAFDNIPGSVSLESYDWNGYGKEVMMIFGSEGAGISKETLDICDKIVSISDYGSVRSMNVGSASGIAMLSLIHI